MIKLSNKGDYAMKSMVYLLKNSDKSIKISEISNDLNISESLLRRIIALLHKGGLVYTKKGRNGGLSLGKKASDISVYDILFCVGEELGISNCTKGIYCINKKNCNTTSIYGNIQKGLNSILKLYTLDKFYLDTKNE